MFLREGLNICMCIIKPPWYLQGGAVWACNIPENTVNGKLEKLHQWNRGKDCYYTHYTYYTYYYYTFLVHEGKPKIQTWKLGVKSETFVDEMKMFANVWNIFEFQKQINSNCLKLASKDVEITPVAETTMGVMTWSCFHLPLIACLNVWYFAIYRYVLSLLMELRVLEGMQFFVLSSRIITCGLLK